MSRLASGWLNTFLRGTYPKPHPYLHPYLPSYLRPLPSPPTFTPICTPTCTPTQTVDFTYTLTASATLACKPTHPCLPPCGLHFCSFTDALLFIVDRMRFCLACCKLYQNKLGTLKLYQGLRLEAVPTVCRVTFCVTQRISSSCTSAHILPACNA